LAWYDNTTIFESGNTSLQILDIAVQNATLTDASNASYEWFDNSTIFEAGNTSVEILDVAVGNATLTDTYNITYDKYDMGNTSTQILDVAVGNATLTNTYNITYDIYDMGNSSAEIRAAVDADTNATTECAGTTTYLDGEGNCDDISGVYVDDAGDTMTGNLDFGSQYNITNLYNTTYGTDQAFIYWNGTNLIIEG